MSANQAWTLYAGLETVGATACPSYKGAVQVQQMLAARLASEAGSPPVNFSTNHGLQQTTCVMILPRKDEGMAP